MQTLGSAACQQCVMTMDGGEAADDRLAVYDSGGDEVIGAHDFAVTRIEAAFR